MYMPNASPNAKRPNATYIPLASGFASGKTQLLVSRWVKCEKFASPNARDTNMLIFLALGNAKVLSFAKVPNANDFGLQSNIGLRMQNSLIYINCIA